MRAKNRGAGPDVEVERMPPSKHFILGSRGGQRMCEAAVPRLTYDYILVLIHMHRGTAGSVCLSALWCKTATCVAPWESRAVAVVVV